MPRNFITVVRESRAERRNRRVSVIHGYVVSASRWNSGNGNGTLNRCHYYNEISENRLVAWNQEFIFRIGKR
jgi:hypothetical protein